MAIRGEFGRGSSGRGETSRIRSSFRGASSNVSLGATAKILRSADETRARVEAHHEKHQARWVQKRYGDLLSKTATSRDPAPLGLGTDPKERLMHRARSQVATKQSIRLERVEKARANMLQTGRIRATRNIDWSKGYGD